ncbi:hypothetical protein D3C81_979030 [compost metagenome]
MSARSQLRARSAPAAHRRSWCRWCGTRLHRGHVPSDRSALWRRCASRADLHEGQVIDDAVRPGVCGRQGDNRSCRGACKGNGVGAGGDRIDGIECQQPAPLREFVRQCDGILMVNMCVNAAGATGAVNAIAQVEYFNDADESLGLFPSFGTYSVRDAINDPLLPNYALGANRWLDTHGYRAVAPLNTAYGKMRFAVATFDGTVYVSRARVWRG